MPGLFDSLTNASRSLDAHRLGIDVAGQNLANVNTEGYTRRRLTLGELPPTDVLSAGRGVEVIAIRSQRDQFIEARLRREETALAFDNAVVDGLSVIEAAVGTAGTSLDQRLTEFFAAYSFLANDVTSISAREALLQQGRSLATGFNDMAERLTAVASDADRSIRDAVTEVNQLAAQVAALNGQIIFNGVDVESMRDQRDLALSRLSQLADVSVLTRADGAVDVTFAAGRPLVVGPDAYTVSAVSTGPSGNAQIILGDFDITNEIGGGSIGGYLTVRDNLLPSYRARVDALAYDVATAVNGIHTTGFDAQGNAAGDFFAAPSAVAGAAAAFAIDPSVDADSRLIAGSATGTAGDNGIAKAIANLRDATIADGGTATPTTAWGQFVYTLGSDIAAARSSGDGREQVVRQMQRLRDQASGVSVDEEAANLIRFQRAYEANARYFTVISDTLETLLNMVR